MEKTDAVPHSTGYFCKMGIIPHLRWLIDEDQWKEGNNMGIFSKLFSKNEGMNNANHLYAPMAGAVVSVADVPDPAFAEGMLGDGIAIIPTDGKIYAPCDATVDMMFTTGHAVSLTTESGAEILIHMGLETVTLEGKAFDVKVATGDKVSKGQVLMIADLEAIRAAGLNTITPMLVCNSADFSTFKKTTGRDVTNDDVVIALAK